MSLLSIAGLEVSYGNVPVLFGVDVEIAEGEIVAVLGPNGAGKSTLLRSVSGLVQPRSGSMSFRGRDLTGVSEHERVKLGLAHVPEGRRVFPSLTVRENLRLGGYVFRADRHRLEEGIERACATFPILAERADQRASTLSGGEQQMLAIARGLMSSPALLMVDEASLGLAPLVVEQLFELMTEINADGTSLLVVEQSARVSLEIADRAYVLERGRVAYEGSAAELRADPRMDALYLGGGTSSATRGERRGR